jgi:hypothetical protein
LRRPEALQSVNRRAANLSSNSISCTVMRSPIWIDKPHLRQCVQIRFQSTKRFTFRVGWWVHRLMVGHAERQTRPNHKQQSSGVSPAGRQKWTALPTAPLAPRHYQPEIPPASRRQQSMAFPPAESRERFSTRLASLRYVVILPKTFRIGASGFRLLSAHESRVVASCSHSGRQSPQIHTISSFVGFPILGRKIQQDMSALRVCRQGF